jgi:excisionase family DNA binding protein
MQPSINTAFEAEPPSSPMQPDTSKWKLLAVSLLYTERIEGDMPDPLLRPSEVAQILGVSADTVRRLCRRGEIEHVRLVNAIGIPQAELKRFMTEHRMPRRARDATVVLARRRRGAKH